MIKLTVLNHKIKDTALERFHKINEFSENLLFQWEEDKQKAIDTNIDVPSKPFIEPFEFELEDYEITELPFRIREQDILYYKTNTEGVTEIILNDKENSVYNIKEDIETLDKIFLAF